MLKAIRLFYIFKIKYKFKSSIYDDGDIQNFLYNWVAFCDTGCNQVFDKRKGLCINFRNYCNNLNYDINRIHKKEEILRSLFDINKLDKTYPFNKGNSLEERAINHTKEDDKRRNDLRYWFAVYYSNFLR